MLPQIAAGFVNEARLAKDTAAQEALLKKTEAAMALVNNPEYIPSTLRKSQATTIESITEDMARVRREIDRVQNLNATIETINAAATIGRHAGGLRRTPGTAQQVSGARQRRAVAGCDVEDFGEGAGSRADRGTTACPRDGRSRRESAAARRAVPSHGTGHCQCHRPCRVHAGRRQRVCTRCLDGRRACGAGSWVSRPRSNPSPSRPPRPDPMRSRSISGDRKSCGWKPRRANSSGG